MAGDLDHGKELSTLDFSNLIGGPLNAVVEAQAKSAITTADFIKTVGFDKDNKVITTDFEYTKEDADGNTADFKLSVPFLTMLPIPYVEVDEASIEFNANITSTTSSNSSSDFSGSTSTSGGGGWWFARASFKANASYQKKSSSTQEVKKTYSMQVKVRAKQADMPAGTSKILSILENVITEKKISGFNVSFNGSTLTIPSTTVSNDFAVGATVTIGTNSSYTLKTAINNGDTITKIELNENINSSDITDGAEIKINDSSSDIKIIEIKKNS